MNVLTESTVNGRKAADISRLLVKYPFLNCPLLDVGRTGCETFSLKLNLATTGFVSELLIKFLPSLFLEPTSGLSWLVTSLEFKRLD